MRLQPTYNHSEQFTYDIADRLTMWKVQYPFKTGSYTYTANYSDNGNIVLKSDFGYYSYSKKTKPHAVSGISSLIAGTGDERTCEAEYNTIGKVSKLTLKNGSTTLKTATFVYGPDGQRRRMSTGNSASTYSGDYQVNRYNGGGEQQLHYISGPAGLCALIVRNYNCGKLISCTIYHLQTDYQNSIIAAYNSNGTLYKHFSYDPWGRRRVGGAWDNCLVATETLITRGYCGHEHLDDFGTINMNGRIYDPRLGRFLSPDPYVQAPYNSQNYNRYSYCLNNPLKYTDPDGEWIHIVIGALVGGVINVATHWKDIDNIWEGIGSFTIGAGAGAVTAATGGATSGFFASAAGAAVVATGAGAVTAAGNSVITQGNGTLTSLKNDVIWKDVGTNAIIGGASGIATYGLGQLSSNLGVADKLLNATNVKNTIVRNIAGSTINGTIIGTGSGFTAGLVDGAFNGNWNLLGNTLNGMWRGAAGGFLYGSITEIGYQAQLKNGYRNSLNSNNIEAVANGGHQFIGNLGNEIIECIGVSINVTYNTASGSTIINVNYPSTSPWIPTTPYKIPNLPSNDVLKLLR